MAKSRLPAEAMRLDDLFSTEASRQEQQHERILDIPLEELHRFKDHPYRVQDNDEMQDLASSIGERGVLIPALVRPRAEGGYELVSGNRRHRASQLAEKETIPCIVRDMDDDTAIIAMVDSNIQREDLLPSEKAKAYKMKMDAMKRKAGRPMKNNSRQVVGNYETSDIIGKDSSESGRQVQRYIRLNELAPDLLNLVDETKMAFTPAVELSFLKPVEQQALADLIQVEERTPSLSQAQQMKKLSQMGQLTEDTMLSIITEKKPQQKLKVTLEENRLSKYFPKSYTPKQIEDTIFKLLDNWLKQKQREQDNGAR